MEKRLKDLDAHITEIDVAASTCADAASFRWTPEAPAEQDRPGAVIHMLALEPTNRG
ncbi:hypothetical protein [Actinoplanes sp. URMC 104]|uniref:hypothetical protein n=1 Tax=Actinoplanes sp. URMC 104 TaxID=3423409 RepID=UPI003F1DD8A6